NGKVRAIMRLKKTFGYLGIEDFEFADAASARAMLWSAAEQSFMRRFSGGLWIENVPQDAMQLYRDSGFTDVTFTDGHPPAMKLGGVNGDALRFMQTLGFEPPAAPEAIPVAQGPTVDYFRPQDLRAILRYVATEEGGDAWSGVLSRATFYSE